MFFDMPFYSSHPSSGVLHNTLKEVLDQRGMSAFKLSKEANLSPTTTRKIYHDHTYIPSPNVLERMCIVLQVGPGELLTLTSIIGSGIQGSGIV
tara:strand:- start:175 stop:456 length:282 start_codon:yes stop_codon:yes gene_type:complete